MIARLGRPLRCLLFALARVEKLAMIRSTYNTRSANSVKCWCGWVGYYFAWLLGSSSVSSRSLTSFEMTDRPVLLSFRAEGRNLSPEDS